MLIQPLLKNHNHFNTLTNELVRLLIHLNLVVESLIDIIIQYRTKFIA